LKNQLKHNIKVESIRSELLKRAEGVSWLNYIEKLEEYEKTTILYLLPTIKEIEYFDIPCCNQFVTKKRHTG